MNHDINTQPIPFKDILRSIEVRPIFSHEKTDWNTLMSKYHYLGFNSLVGESIRYIASFQGQCFALLGWAAAALKCKVRDQWIGWSPCIKYQRLSLLANNSRFLIFPHIRIPNLASRILSLNLKRLSDDWQSVYGHPIWLAETFVDPQRFKGTCYKAAGWSFLGHTKGFAKCSTRYTFHNQPKLVFVRSLCSEAKEQLTNPSLSIILKQEMKPMKLSKKNADDLIEYLSKIPDPRFPRGVRHKKISILAVSLCAIISNARGFDDIAQWAKRCSQSMLKRLRCRYDKKINQYKPPSEPTIRRFLQKVDAKSIDQALCGWIQSLFNNNSAAVAVDGKVLKGARQDDGKQVNLMSAFLHGYGAVIAQCQVENKTNEISMVSKLLEQVDLKDRVVTFDALHTQKKTAQYLVEEKQADYLFTVKDNQKTLNKDIGDLKMVSFPP